MQVKCRKTRISITFPFAAVITFMLLLCEEEIVLISVFSSLFHELGHLFFMLLFKSEPSLIVFGAFGIRIERESLKLPGYKKEALIASGGIFANGLLSLCGVFIYIVFNSLFGAKLFAVNFFIAAFNMLPVKQLDCGRCIECVFGAALSPEKSERLLTVISYVTVAVITLLCLIYNIFIGINISLIAVCLYIILVTTLKE